MRKKTIDSPTRDSILQRLAIGPTTFEEIAVAKNARHPARVEARRICNELVDEGSILLVHIGAYRYYILNTEEAKRNAIMMQIEESARRDKESGCLVWTGYADPDRGPAMRTRLLSDAAAALSVRRVLWTLINGALDQNQSVKMRPACDDLCVDVCHMRLTTRSQILKGKPKSLAARAKMSRSVATRHGTTPEMVAAIRASDETLDDLAKKFGMHRSNVSLIRRFQSHRFVHGLAGLGTTA